MQELLSAKTEVCPLWLLSVVIGVLFIMIVLQLLFSLYCDHWHRQLWSTGARAPSTSSNNFFSSFRSRIKSITANSIWLFILYSFENVWNWQRGVFCDTVESTKIVCPRWGSLRRYFNPLGGRGGGMPLPFFIQSTPFGVSVSTPQFVALSHRRLQWRRHFTVTFCDRRPGH